MGYEIEVVDNGDGTLSFNQINVNVHALTETESCARCAGSGRITGGEVCPVCGGTGEIVTAITGYEKDEGEAGLPVFTNGLEDGALSVTKYTTWTDIEPDADQEFTFHVQFIGENIDENTAVNYTKEQVENDPDAQPASNPTPVRSNPTSGGTEDVYAILYSDGELVFQYGNTPETGRDVTATYTMDSRGWLGKDIATVTFKDRISPTTTAHWFDEPGYHEPDEIRLTTINHIENLDTSNVTDMSYMFAGCTKLTELDVSGFDTSNVTNMSYIFQSCASLTSLDVSGWNVEKVTNMSSMFQSCASLTSLDLRSWNTSSLTVVGRQASYYDGDYGMFSGCTSLRTLYLGSNFDTSKVTHMGALFKGCRSLTSLDLSSFNTSQVTNMKYMFDGCSGLTSINVRGWDTTQVKDMAAMFKGCSSLTELDLSSFVTSSLTTMEYYVFTNPVSPWEHQAGMFEGCSSLKTLNLSNFNTRRLESYHYMVLTFSGCDQLSTIVFGENFEFGSGPYLPTPPEDEDYTGLWVRQGEPDTARTAAELSDSYNSDLAGTWVWQSVGYTVEFTAPEGAGGSMATLHYDPHVEFTLPANSFYLYDNDFLGWDADGDGEVDYEDQATLTAGAVGEVLTLTAVFAPVDHTTILNNGGFDLKLKGGEKATITGIPAGTAYQVWEETESGWVLVSQENVSGNIAPLETAEAKFTNNYQPGTATVALVGAKTLDGAAASAGAFSFQLKEGSKVLQTISNSDGGFIQFTPITYTVKDVGRHVYTVSEVRGGNSAIDYDTHTEQIVVVVSGDADSLTATVSSNGFKFANTTRPGSLEITKIGEGVNDANEDTEFTFRVRLTNDSGQPLTDGDGYNWYVKGSQPASNPTPARSNPTTGSIVPTTTASTMMSAGSIAAVMPATALSTSSS